MSDEQQEHALAVERLAPRLAALRIELCPGYMSEGCFWKIYFVLLLPRLNKHDAELLSTPQIVEARAALMQGIQHPAKAKAAEDHPESGTSNIEADLPHAESLSVPYSAQSKSVPFKEAETEVATTSVAVEISTEKHPLQSTEVQVVDKSIIEEEPIKEAKHQHSTSGSSVVSIEKYEDDGDDWLKEETSEAVGTSATTVPLDNDEDVPFSDLEEEEDVPISYR
ncbi:putative amino acid binding protein [Hibiscus syriacus]|uniref:Amino acid binding protein n=2 Tax=Hibiscus syriacus TaxID=106335 RepID=A0A6A2ZR63_HIBSY|nr:putative amino acid binding protein [Hibiscus syriacus]